MYPCRAKSLQSCLTLCDPMNCSPPGSSVHGILQARILEWLPFPSPIYVSILLQTLLPSRLLHNIEQSCMCYRRRQWHPTPVLLPGKSHGRRSLEACSPWGRCGSDTTEWLHFHFPLSCIGEGNGNSLQCSCLENPRDGRAWWAAVCGVAQSWTRLKRLSSSSSRLCAMLFAKNWSMYGRGGYNKFSASKDEIVQLHGEKISTKSTKYHFFLPPKLYQLYE